MTAQPWRLPEGGLIDRARPLGFRFDGRRLTGYAGDSLASALLANGVRLVARSFKYHRPRGLLSAGPEEPNALVRVGTGGRAEPNIRATELPLSEGLVAASQNRWPSRAWDLGGLAGAAAPLLPAGFYYKTFMAPAKAWRVYERLIRRAAGLGRAPEAADPDRYEQRHAHPEVLIVGAGPAGLMAALAAGRAGARVLLCDERPRLGGSLLQAPAAIDGRPARDWLADAAAELEALAEARLLTRTSVFGYYAHNYLLAVEHCGAGDTCRQRLWKIRAGRVVLATGAIERPLVFPDNDRPGILLAAAARAYLHQFAVRPGTRAVVVANNDSAYGTAAALAAAGIDLTAVVDQRPEVGEAVRALIPPSVPLHSGAVVTATRGRRAVRGVTAAGRRYACDLVCVSGGWTPTVHLFSQGGGTLDYAPEIGAFLPARAQQPVRVAGAANGRFALADCLAEGAAAGTTAAEACGRSPVAVALPRAAADGPTAGVAPELVPPRGRGKAFVDFQNDVTLGDLVLALREGYASVEHVKRYTTAGMGTDQGKTANLNAIALIAQMQGAAPGAVGFTTYRPPYTPVTFGAIAGRALGKRLAPTRRTPFHDCWRAAGAVMLESGAWLYPRYFPGPGETMADAVAREARAVRGGLGAVDMSSLGKVDLKGRDAVVFLERVYCNDLAGLGEGRVRYALMLREDGVVLDDGTVARLGPRHYLLSLTTANAGKAWLHLEKLRQVFWPELDVRLASVTDQWANLAVAGPKARELLAVLGPDFPVDGEAFPFMAVREGAVAGLPARVLRISFSGELGYEINVPADYGEALWAAVRAAGGPLGLTPYGLETLDLLRVEKGHVAVGGEIDGRTTADDLGLGRLVSRKKDFLGKALLARPAFARADRLQLVGLTPADGASPVPPGAQLTADGETSLGHVTAAVTSPGLGRPIALALLAGGRARHGETLRAASPAAGRSVAVTVSQPCFYDPKGERLRD